MRQLPFSLDAEMALLGTLMVYPEAVDGIAEYNLRIDDFYSTAHQTIFEHMTEIMERKSILDATTLITRMSDHHDLDAVGGVDYLFLLTQNSATPNSLKHYVEVVQEKAQMRRLIMVGQDIAEKGFDTSNDLNFLLDFAESSILEVTRIRRTTDMLTSREVVKAFLEHLEHIRKNKDRITGLRTG